MKFTQIAVSDKDSLYALADNGEIYYGYFLNHGDFKKPEIKWRRLPNPMGEKIHTYKMAKEFTDEELQAKQEELNKAQILNSGGPAKKASWKFWA